MLKSHMLKPHMLSGTFLATFCHSSAPNVSSACETNLEVTRALVSLPKVHNDAQDVLGVIELELDLALAAVGHGVLGAGPPGLGVVTVAVVGQSWQAPVAAAAVFFCGALVVRRGGHGNVGLGSGLDVVAAAAAAAAVVVVVV